MPAKSKLPINLWSLSLVAAAKQAHCPIGPVPAAYIIAISLFKAVLQQVALWLVVDAIDPFAAPVTTFPGDPWIKSPWSVNCMKWLVVTLIAVFMVSEASDCKQHAEALLLTNPRRLTLPKGVLFLIAGLQLSITLTIVWGGVVVVLSFKSVPNILYSSMTIIGIAKVDKGFLHVVLQMMNITGDFTIVHGLKQDCRHGRHPVHVPCAHHAFEDIHTFEDLVGTDYSKSWSAGSPKSPRPKDTIEMLADLVHQPISPAVYVLLRVIVLSPCSLAFGLISWAWYTNLMPTGHYHMLKRFLLGDAGTF